MRMSLLCLCTPTALAKIGDSVQSYSACNIQCWMQIAIMVPVVADGVSAGCTMSLYMYSILGRRLSTDMVSPPLIYVEDWPRVVKSIRWTKKNFPTLVVFKNTRYAINARCKEKFISFLSVPYFCYSNHLWTQYQKQWQWLPWYNIITFHWTA